MKVGVIVTAEQLKSLYEAAMSEDDCEGFAALLAILKDDVAAVL